MRLIIDKLGSGRDDLFLKLDTIPSYSQTADSFYLFDFLEITNEEFEKLNLSDGESLKYGAIKLLKYWKNRIESIERNEIKFIPFDLWDEYIGGLLLQKTKLAFKTKRVITQKIHGYGVRKSNLDEQIKKNKIDFEESEQAEWMLSEQAIYQGLNWSIEELKK